ncbi:Protein phosphatase 1 regulatory subunit 12A [Portunus trituberculatus]|uniref:Protein phosphatase 1 regulatory subunit 12A n=1 Tax=Portunus trituberculatus TaxID=210409 RepID=A0A5B7D7K2_PORTR|nr:Protein phosphatase 1 regulatory subunit 12A [Portunus trituberculatus]
MKGVKGTRLNKGGSGMGRGGDEERVSSVKQQQQQQQQQEPVWAEPPEVRDGAAMAGDNRSTSALFKRAEQIRRWQESETNKQDIVDNHRTRKVNFTDGCVFLAACAAGDKQEVIRLLEKGADIDTANVDGLTALHAVSASPSPRRALGAALATLATPGDAGAR